jgi:acetyl esterase/lipase
MSRLNFLFVVLLILAGAAVAQEAKKKRQAAAYPPSFPEARAEVYKTVGDVKLSLYIFTPPDHKPEGKRPAIVFFFGGGWRAGNPAQFHEHAKHLAARGMVAITADYRVASRHDVKAAACVADAKSAIRYVRRHAARLGIDPDRLAAGGGSAGGHLAACTGTIQGFDEPAEDKSISSVPNALVLFNPALVLAPVEGLDLDKERLASLGERMGVEPKELSPYHHVKQGVPPTLILHGKADTTVPYSTAEAFAKSMTAAGNRCELVGYENQTHGFFNFGRGDGTHYTRTVQAMDEFLTSLGYLAPPKAAGK